MKALHIILAGFFFFGVSAYSEERVFEGMMVTDEGETIAEMRKTITTNGGTVNLKIEYYKPGEGTAYYTRAVEIVNNKVKHLLMERFDDKNIKKIEAKLNGDKYIREINATPEADIDEPKAAIEVGDGLTFFDQITLNPPIVDEDGEAVKSMAMLIDADSMKMDLEKEESVYVEDMNDELVHYNISPNNWAMKAGAMLAGFEINLYFKDGVFVHSQGPLYGAPGEEFGKNYGSGTVTWKEVK